MSWIGMTLRHRLNGGMPLWAIAVGITLLVGIPYCMMSWWGPYWSVAIGPRRIESEESWYRWWYWPVFIFIIFSSMRDRRTPSPNAHLNESIACTVTIIGLFFMVVILSPFWFSGPIVKRRVTVAAPAIAAFYRDPETTLILGRAVRLELLHARNKAIHPGEREAITALTDALPQAWVTLATRDLHDAITLLAFHNHTQDPVKPTLTSFLLERSENGFSPEAWGDVLDAMCDAGGLTRLSGRSRAEATMRLSRDFAEPLRAATRAAIERGDEDWALLYLDATVETLLNAANGTSSRDPEYLTEWTIVTQERKALEAHLALKSSAAGQ